MTDKFQDKYRIPSARLPNWDYGWNAMYFVTICTAHRACYFGNITDGKMIVSNIGIIADVFWHEIKNHANTVDMGEFVVMPNHIHGILILNEVNEKNNDIDGNAVWENNDDGIIAGVGLDVNANANVETRHALSLQSSSQSSPQPVSPQSSQPEKTIAQKRFQNQGKNTVSSIIGAYKSAVSKHAHRLGFDFAWQSRFYDHIIHDEGEYQRISDYIRNNPSNWTEDKFYDMS
jgi:REP element-mobilizing transposase RayT